jgi:hypothetical protein
MVINSVKRQENENTQLVGYLLNKKSSVPLDLDNRHYRAILEWIEDGNTPEPADVIVPPDTTVHDDALARLTEMAKTDPGIADILILLGK